MYSLHDLVNIYQQIWLFFPETLGSRMKEFVQPGLKTPFTVKCLALNELVTVGKVVIWRHADLRMSWMQKNFLLKFL